MPRMPTSRAPIPPALQPGAVASPLSSAQAIAPDGSVPSPMRAILDPPTTAQRAHDPAVRWVREQVYVPTPWHPVSDYIAQQVRRYVLQSVTNVAAGTETPRQVPVATPCTLYALTGAAYDTTGTALPAGLSSLDTFRVRLEHSTGDRIDTLSGLGSALLGTASFPALIGGPGWHFDRGASINVFVTPLRNNLSIDVVLWVIEFAGPANYNPLG